MTLAPPATAPPSAQGGGGAAGAWAVPATAAGPPATVRTTWALTLIWFSAALSVLAVWVLLYALALSGFQEAGAQNALYATFRARVAQGIAPLGGDIKPGQPVALLRVPQAGIRDVVLEGTTSGILEEGPGLEIDTPLPGQPGVSVIYGRQTLFGGPFRHLDALRRGDVFAVTTGEGTFAYLVMDLRYPGDPYPPPLPTGGSRIVLVTAAGSGWRSAGAPNRELFVDASLIGRPAAAVPPPVLAGGLPAAQQPKGTDTGALVALVFWLQALLATVLAAVWVRTRWGGWQTWLVAAPAILAALWAASEPAFQLLPNLL